jgi:hypothetical protein
VGTPSIKSVYGSLFSAGSFTYTPTNIQNNGYDLNIAGFMPRYWTDSSVSVSNVYGAPIQYAKRMDHGYCNMFYSQNATSTTNVTSTTDGAVRHIVININ